MRDAHREYTRPAPASDCQEDGWPPCSQAQADGVPCQEVGKDCEDCEKAFPNLRKIERR